MIRKTIYDSLNLNPLKEIGIIIQLNDHTYAYPDGVIEDISVQVDELVFLTNFYVLYMDDKNSPNSSPITLGGRLLLSSTIYTKIDISKITLTIVFDDAIVAEALPN